MKNMIDVAYDYLKEKDFASFKDIFTFVANEMNDQWKKTFSEKQFKDSVDDKRAELYTVLSVDGRFVRNNDNQWFLTENFSYEEVKKMRINIGENIEDEENI